MPTWDSWTITAPARYNMSMTKVESILIEVKSLSPAERAELVAKLEEQTTLEVEANDLAAGQRGLAAWTDSARNENWEPYYPKSLRNNRGAAS